MREIMTSQMNWYYHFAALLANHDFIMAYLKVVRSEKMGSHLDMYILKCIHAYYYILR